MTKRTWWFTFVTTLLIFGLAACGGDDGGGGAGGGIPTATNSAITPPPTTAVAITTAGGATSTTNQSIAANAFQASDGALSSATTALPLVGALSDNSGTQAKRETLRAVVRRHAEKLKDHQSEKLKDDQSSATSAVQVATQACSGGGTITFAFDDANLSATEVFVNCNEGGFVMHGTISSSNVGVSQSLGSFVGSPYTVTVTATFAIDLSISTVAPASSVVTQGSFTFTTAFSGSMEAAANGGVQPGVPNRVVISMSGASLLSSNGTDRERLSNFSISIDYNDTLGSTTISGGYTYASTIIGGSVTVSISPALVYQPQGALHPSSGAVTITSPASPGKIVLTVISSPVVGVRVDVYADAGGPVTDTVNLTWAQVDAL
jgi:hypothetical protein